MSIILPRVLLPKVKYPQIPTARNTAVEMIIDLFMTEVILAIEFSFSSLMMLNRFIEPV